MWEIISKLIEPEERPKLILTEFGIDSGACHWDPGYQGGYQSFFGREEMPQLFNEIAWADMQMCKDNYLVAADWFTWGTRDQKNWGTFDMFGDLVGREAMLCYLEGKHQSIDMRQDMAAYINDPEVMIPANPQAALQVYATKHGLGAPRTRELGYEGKQFVDNGTRYICQMFMSDWDLDTQHILFAPLDSNKPWSERISHFDVTN